jgi:hypothetical protein
LQNFLPQLVEGNDIREDLDYGGVRIILIAHWEQARIQIQVDIGFGMSLLRRRKTSNSPPFLSFRLLICELIVGRRSWRKSFRRW